MCDTRQKRRSVLGARRARTMVMLVAGLTYSAYSLNAYSAPTASFRLTASAEEIDEGQVVQFLIDDKKYIDPATGRDLKLEADLAPVEWDFGNGRQGPASAYGLYEIKHWFYDDAEGGYSVKATHQGATRTVNIRVNDVPPVIHSISVTDNPEAERPVVFQAAVRDPGFNDSIEFTWDFGGGATATGPNAIHTWGEPGTYSVTLSVKDEERDDSPATFTFPVNVGDFYGDTEENTFSVSGDISVSETAIDGLILVGASAGGAGEDCQVRIEMRSAAAEMGIVLTARLRPGLAPGNYSIGTTEEWDGASRQDAAQRGTFFAEFYPPEDKQYRIERGRKIGGPFWSDRGRVTITRFDGEALELFFEAAFTENIPEGLGPRTVAARGALQTAVSAPVDVRSPADARSIPGLEALTRSLLRRGADGLDVNSYTCAGQEPEEFELVAAAPDANAVNFNYEDSTIELEFSQVVDPDSIVHPETLEDNLLVALRTDDGSMAAVPGSWMISQRNPRAVQFIPQARLVPGAIHCIYVDKGEDGLRSFSGSILAGSTLATPSEQMRDACEAAGANRIGHAFATRVELENIGVDLYQRSLLGPHAKFSYVPGGGTIARVYPWWQDSFRNLHDSAAVREFDARIFAVIDRQGLRHVDEGTGSRNEYAQRTIRRPDLYSAADKRTMRHSIEFLYQPDANPRTLNYFAVVQPLDKDGAPVEPVDPGPITQLETSAPLSLPIGLLGVEVDCDPSLTEGLCSTEHSSDAAVNDVDRLITEMQHLLLPPTQARLRRYTASIAVTETCPGGIVNETCFGRSGASLSADDMRSRLQRLAQQIMIDDSIYAEPTPDFEILLVALTPGLMDPDARAAVVYRRDDLDQPVILVDAGRYGDLAVQQTVVAELLHDEEACRFEGDSICDETPVQGLVLLPTGSHYALLNRHEVEGTHEGPQPYPLMRSGGDGDAETRVRHISAWNYARLYEVLDGR